MWLNPLTWITVSLVAYAGVVNLLWVGQAVPSRYRALRRLLELTRQPLVGLTARTVYLLGVPVLAVALRLPGLTPARLGLPTQLGVPTSAGIAPLGPAVAIGLLTFSAMIGGPAWFDRATGRPGTLLPRRLTAGEVGWLALFALLLEAHWAFFRAAILTVDVGSRTALVYLALGVLSLEAWMNPGRRSKVLDPHGAAGLARGAALAVQSALVFLVTGSSILCLVAHLGATWASAAVLPAHRTSVADWLTPTGELAPAEPTIV